MARLRYNGVIAELAADVTSSDTTFTFDSTLKHAGGTNVPTVTGSDYFALSIVSMDGELLEVVYVTAYTAGSTTATVTRGREDTTAIAHSTGLKLVCAPTAEDYKLALMSDVGGSAPSNGQVLTWNNAAGQWRPATPSGGGGGGGATSLAELNDVDVADVYDGALLTYDAGEGVWKPDLATVDQRNFRGDWQDPANTLLWSTEFADPDDADLFTSHGPVGTKAAVSGLLTTITGYATVGTETAMRLTTSTQGRAGATLPMTAIDLGGRYISSIKFWAGARYTASSGSKTLIPMIGDTDRDPRTAGPNVTVFAWQEQTLTVEGIVSSFSVDALSASGTFTYELTRIYIYGATSNDDLYRLGDVVAHNDKLWRSLFGLNSDEPSSASHRWEEISATDMWPARKVLNTWTLGGTYQSGQLVEHEDHLYTPSVPTTSDPILDSLGEINPTWRRIFA